MLKVNQVQKDEIYNEDYEVLIDGKKVDCYSARVSKEPYNTPWPGMQRLLSQTELNQFFSVFADKKIQVKVKPLKKALNNDSDIVIRPLSKKVEYKVIEGYITFELIDKGAYSLEIDGFHNSLTIFFNSDKQFQAKDGEKVIHYKKGIHEIGDIEIDSNTTVIVDEGAVLYGSVSAYCAENVKILGYGIIDGSKEVRNGDEALYEYDYDNILPQDKENLKKIKQQENVLDGCIRFYRCKNVVVEGVITRDPASFNVILSGCDNVVIDNVKVIGSWRYNSDGIDLLNSKNVIIKNCYVRAFDDCIVLKGVSGWEDNNLENILVDNCVVWCDWGRNLEIGAETVAKEYKNITMQNCDLIHGSVVFIDIQHHNMADIHDVVFKDINVELTKYHLPYVLQTDMNKEYSAKPNTDQPTVLGAFILNSDYFSKTGLHGKVHDIQFKNVNIIKDKEVDKPKVGFVGISSSNDVKDVIIENLMINGKKVEDKGQLNYCENEFCSNIVIK